MVAGQCKPKHKFYKSPPGYNFSSLETTKLDDRLREISGIAWDPTKNEFAAIHDEKGEIFYLDKESKGVRRFFEFAEKKDYEDIAIVNSVPYVLISDGTVIRINADSTGKEVTITELGQLPIEGSKDIETMYYDPTRRALVLLCKNCDIDQKKTVSAFAYYLDSSGWDKNPIYRIDLSAIEKLSPEKSTRLEPSGAAIHPQQQKLYILSSASNQLVLADLNGKPEQVFMLMKKIFKQPEGICIKNNGELYISNEGVTSKATLIRCMYTRK